MKIIIRIFKIIFLALLITGTTLSQWKPTTGPFGGRVSSLTQCNSKIFVGTDQGLFYSTNEGGNWEFVQNIPISSFGPSSITTTGSTIFASGVFSGIIISTDEGVSWTDFSLGITDNALNNITANDSRVVVGTASTIGGNVYLSKKINNNWTTWNKIRENLSYCMSVAINDSSIFVIQDGIKRTTNDGISWDNIIIDSTKLFNMLLAANSTIYTSCNSGIYKSTDNGSSWNCILDNIYISTFSVNGNIIIASVLDNLGYNLIVSTDMGITWNSGMNGIYNKVASALLIKDNTLFVGTQVAGVFRSTNLGLNWFPIVQGLVPLDISNIYKKDSYLYASDISVGTFVSSDMGNNWQLTLPKTTNRFVNKGNVIYATGRFNPNLYSTIDYGTSWVTNIGLNSTISMVSNLNRLFLTDANYLYSTEDGSIISQITTAPNNCTYLAIINNNLVAGTSIGEVYLSTNEGLTWQNRSFGLPAVNSKVLELAANDTDLFVDIECSSFDSTGIYKSSDLGLTWLPILMNHYITKIYAKDNLVFTCGHFWNGGVMASSDNGQNWIDFNSGLEDLLNFSITDIIADDSNVYVGVNKGDSSLMVIKSGVWVRPISDLLSDVEEDNNNIPKKFLLSQNYPNPFNPNTKFNYSIPAECFVNISIYNTLGEQVVEIFDGIQKAGTHELTFNASKLSSGIYFYRLSSGRFFQTKKMVLIK
ncbi:MAG: T9SS type A sorting domain-containing protein [bacterium]